MNPNDKPKTPLCQHPGRLFAPKEEQRAPICDQELPMPEFSQDPPRTDKQSFSNDDLTALVRTRYGKYATWEDEMLGCWVDGARDVMGLVRAKITSGELMVRLFPDDVMTSILRDYITHCERNKGCTVAMEGSPLDLARKEYARLTGAKIID